MTPRRSRELAAMIGAALVAAGALVGLLWGLGQVLGL